MDIPKQYRVVLDNALRVYGSSHQVQQSLSELGELVAAIGRVQQHAERRSVPIRQFLQLEPSQLTHEETTDRANLTEETGDAQIGLWYLVELLGHAGVDLTINTKLQRLSEIMHDQ